MHGHTSGFYQIPVTINLEVHDTELIFPRFAFPTKVACFRSRAWTVMHASTSTRVDVLRTKE